MLYRFKPRHMTNKRNKYIPWEENDKTHYYLQVRKIRIFELRNMTRKYISAYHKVFPMSHE